ncbi:MAG: hypothetical protein H0V05_15130 [Euzebyaceae bacterium]|nr:hypothetical protein [Euzebyaceae bacterium]
MAMRNITLTMPEELVRRAKIAAAERDTSVSALVAEYFGALVQQEDGYDLMWAEEERLMQEGLPMRVGEITWSRADLHER